MEVWERYGRMGFWWQQRILGVRSDDADVISMALRTGFSSRFFVWADLEMNLFTKFGSGIVGLTK